MTLQDSLTASLHRAETLYRQRLVPEAAATYQAILRANPENLDAHFGFAICLGDLGHTQEAIAAVQTCLKLSDGSPFFSGPLSQMLNNQGRFDEALQVAQNYQRAFPEDRKGRQTLATAYAGNGIHEEAERILQELTRDDPTDALAWNDLGCLYWDQGRRTDARETWQTALVYHPDNKLLQENLVSDDEPDARHALILSMLQFLVKVKVWKTRNLSKH